MESFILWGIGIFVYLLIGRGFKMSFKALKEKEGEQLSKIDLILYVLLWPVDFGYLISQASAYYQNENNRVYGFGLKLPFKHALYMEIFEMKGDLGSIEKTLHSIENSLQKDNDKKDV